MQSLVGDRTNACLSDMTYDDTSIFPLLRLAPNSEERLGPEARIGGRTKKNINEATRTRVHWTERRKTSLSFILFFATC